MASLKLIVTGATTVVPAILEAEAGECRVQDQPGLHRQTLSKIK
jgi:hypothetical protein